MLKNPAYIQFFLTAAIVDFISTAIGFRMFQIWKLDLELQISLEISLKWNLI